MTHDCYTCGDICDCPCSDYFHCENCFQCSEDMAEDWGDPDWEDDEEYW